MYILLLIINIGFGVWLSMNNSVWIYLLNIFLVLNAAIAICTSTVQALRSGRSILLGHVLGLIFAFIAFRSHLLLFPIWLILQVGASFYCAWEDGFIGHGKYKEAKVKRAEVLRKIRQLRQPDSKS